MTLPTPEGGASRLRPSGERATCRVSCGTIWRPLPDGQNTWSTTARYRDCFTPGTGCSRQRHEQSVVQVHWAKAHQTRAHHTCACGQYTRQACVWQAAPDGALAFTPMAKARGTQPGVLVGRNRLSGTLTR